MRFCTDLLDQLSIFINYLKLILSLLLSNRLYCEFFCVECGLPFRVSIFIQNSFLENFFEIGYSLTNQSFVFEKHKIYFEGVLGQTPDHH